MVVLTLMCGRAPLRRGSLLALVHGVLRHLDQGIGPTLLGRPVVGGAERIGERLDSCFERRATDRIQPGIKPGTCRPSSR